MKSFNSQAHGPHQFLVPIVISIFLVGGIAAAQVTSPIFAWGVMVAAMFGLMLIGKPRTFIWAIVIYGCMEGLLKLYFKSSMKYADEAIFLILLGLMLAYSGMRNNVFKKPGMAVFKKSYVLLAFVTIASGLINGSKPINLIHFIKAYLIFGAYFIIAREFFSGKDAKSFIKVSVVFMVVQVFLNIGWMFSVNPLKNTRWSINDFATGTIGTANNVAYLTAMVFFILYGLFNEKLLSKKRLGIIIIGAFMAIGFFITYTMHAYFLLGAGFLIFYLMNYRSISNKALPILLLILIVPVFFLMNRLTADQTHGSRFERTFSVENIEKRSGVFYEGPKAESYINSFWNLPRESALYWVIGAGPGRYMSTPALTRPGGLTFRYLGEFYLTHTGTQAMSGGSITQTPLIGVCALFGELGILGFGLYVVLYMMPILQVIRNLNGKRYSDTYQRVLAQAYLPSIAVFLMVNMLVDGWFRLFFVFPLWLWAAIIWEPISDENSNAGERACDGVSVEPLDKVQIFRERASRSLGPATMSSTR